MPLDWRSLQGLPEASAYGSHTDNRFRDTYFCASPYSSAFSSGMKPIEVSNQLPQLQPPPPSGDNSMPAAGMVLSQQSGRSLAKLLVLFDIGSQIVTLPAR